MVSVRELDREEIIKLYPELKDAVCHAHCDGECFWELCPQTRDNEVNRKSHCPLPHWTDDEDY